MHTQGPPPWQVRQTRDRRRRRLPSLRVLLLYPRRRKVRRREDRRRLILLDLYPRSLLVSAAAVLLLSAADALLTLFLLQHGAREVNPVMAFFLDKGVLPFLAFKYASTAVAVTLVILVSDNFIPWLRLFARDLLKIFAGLLSAIVVWQLFWVCRLLLQPLIPG